MKLLAFIAIQSFLLLACGPIRVDGEEATELPINEGFEKVEGYSTKTDGSSQVFLYKEGRFSNGSHSKLLMICKSNQCGWGTRPETVQMAVHENSQSPTLGGTQVMMGVLSTQHRDIILGVYEFSENPEETTEKVLTEFQGYPYLFIQDLSVNSYRPHVEDILSVTLDNGHQFSERINNMNSYHRVVRRNPKY